MLASQFYICNNLFRLSGLLEETKCCKYLLAYSIYYLVNTGLMTSINQLGVDRVINPIIKKSTLGLRENSQQLIGLRQLGL